MKYELGGKIVTKFVGFCAKTHGYLIEKGNTEKKSKRHKKIY